MTSTQNIIELEGEIPQRLINKRLDQSLAEMFPDFSRSKIKQWIEQGDVSVNGEVNSSPRHRVAGNEKILIKTTQSIAIKDQPQSIPLAIVFEDENIIVVDKPAGLVVHPGAGNADNTMLNALLSHYPQIESIPRAGIVHRLDKDTTGLMVVAKTLKAQTHLVEQLQSRQMGREYEAIVNGQLISGGLVDEPIGRHPTKRTLMSVRHTGKPATTHYRIVEKFREHTHLRLKLETGRTHQIRVHMTHINHALVGDQQYGGRLQLPKKASPELQEIFRSFKRQALHAAQLTLVHPKSQELLSWQSALPEDMKTLIAFLRKDVDANRDEMY